MNTFSNPTVILVYGEDVLFNACYGPIDAASYTARDETKERDFAVYDGPHSAARHLVAWLDRHPQYKRIDYRILPLKAVLVDSPVKPTYVRL